jgi:hypothetical protein
MTRNTSNVKGVCNDPTVEWVGRRMAVMVKLTVDVAVGHFHERVVVLVVVH